MVVWSKIEFLSHILNETASEGFKECTDNAETYLIGTRRSRAIRFWCWMARGVAWEAAGSRPKYISVSQGVTVSD